MLLLGLLFALQACLEEAFMDDIKLADQQVDYRAGKPKKPGETAEGNCLSYPVIWAEGVTKPLRELPPGAEGPVLNGTWWYWWGTEGTDPNIVPLSCAPDPDDDCFCDDGKDGTTGPPPGEGWVKAYLQKDANNIWQAGSADWSAAPVNVNWIDWGDNLESVDWYTRSQVRTEVVLFQDLTKSMTEYQMRHTSGWGIDEVHGLAADLNVTPLLGDGMRATVYSNCARLTIQKLLVDRNDARLADLEWVPSEGWTEPEGYPDDLINPHLFNGSVHEGGDGPGYYSAEINVKGRIIYGYTWNVRNMNEGPGSYRLTFSFDGTCGSVGLNTYFIEGTTQIMAPLEEELVAAALAVASESSDEGGGGTAVLDFENNLTYMDIRILERGGGGGGSGGGSGGDGGSGGGGGGSGGSGGGGGHNPPPTNHTIVPVSTVSSPVAVGSGSKPSRPSATGSTKPTGTTGTTTTVAPTINVVTPMNTTTPTNPTTNSPDAGKTNQNGGGGKGKGGK